MDIDFAFSPRYINWGYKEHYSDEYYTMKFTYASQYLGGISEEPDDTLVLGTYLYLNGWGFKERYQGTGALYASLTCINDRNTAPANIKLVYDIEKSGSGFNYRYLDCYIVNGLIMTSA